jgi:DNA-binding XRE family transcriptional regulator
MSTKKRDLSLGEFLKAHRLGEELSQTAFAKILGISKQRLCDLETNRSNVSIKLCKSLAKKLDLPPEWLVKVALQHQLKQEGLDLKVS